MGIAKNITELENAFNTINEKFTMIHELNQKRMVGTVNELASLLGSLNTKNLEERKQVMSTLVQILLQDIDRIDKALAEAKKALV